MSQADVNSLTGEESVRAGNTGTGCYKLHEHHLGKGKPPAGDQHEGATSLNSAANKTEAIVETRVQSGPRTPLAHPQTTAVADGGGSGASTPPSYYQTPVR